MRNAPETIVAVVIAILALIAPRAAGADEGVYDVGVARVDVTPGYPIRLNGFGGRRAESEGITQRIWAKALAINAPDEPPIVLITLDSLGIREAMLEEVARRLKEKAGVERDRIAVAYSHSHTTPKLTNVCDTIFSSPIPPEHQVHIEQYTAEVTDALETAALEALASRKPSTLSWAVGKATFAMNRRTPGGPVDHDLPMLVVKSVDDGAVRAIYVTYACHCVTLSDNKISGDWAGYAQEIIERTHPGVVALVSIGCGSDSNPSSGVTGSNTAAATDQGAQIGDEVARLLAAPLKPITGSIVAALSHIDLPLNPLPTQEELEKLAAAGGAAGYNAQYQLDKLGRGEPLQSKLDYPIQTWAFGDSLAMVFLAGEVCVDYSHRLKEELDRDRIWLHGYSNDFCAYIPSERLLKEGGYGGGAEVVYFALPNTIATGVEEKIIGEVHRLIPPQFQGRGPRKPISAQPWPLDEALASITPKRGFVVEVAAAEPLVADPVAIDFGPDGRLWVAEMPDYSRFADDEFEPRGSVRFLTDREGDGRYDDATTFADGLRFPTEVKAWRRGVIVCDAPDVIYFEDANGDGRADARTVLLTGFSTHNTQARVNSLRWGLDNWLYGSCGVFGGRIRTQSGAEVELGGRDFRFRPDTGEFQAVTGNTQQGRDRDDWGNWYGCDNSTLLTHYPLDDRYLARNPRVEPPPIRASPLAGADPSALFPIGEPTLYALSGPPGRPTAACGLGIYRDELLGPEFANNSFTCEPVNQLVHRRVLTPSGATFEAHRPADEAEIEFLAATDPWFRPVQVRTGLDGCLYVVDMHRAVIEHATFIPEDTLRGLDLMAGRDQGRIYRVRPATVPARPILRVDRLDPIGLAEAIDSVNGPQRDLAQQLLVERQANEAIATLIAIARESPRPAARLQAYCTLDGLRAVDAELVAAALADPHPAVRRHAIRLSEPLLSAAPQVADELLRMVDDADSQVAVQLAYTLGELNDPRAAAALARLAQRRQDDPYALAAVWSSVDAGNARQVAAALIAANAAEKPAAGLLEQAVRLVAQLGSDADVLSTAQSLTTTGDATAADWQFAAAAELLAQGHRQNRPVEPLKAQLAPLIAAAREMLATDAADEGQQLTSLRILVAGKVNGGAMAPLLSRLLSPQSPPAVQLAAIDLAATIGGSEGAAALLDPWRGFSPTARGQAFDVLLGNETFTAIMLDRIAAGAMAAGDFDALQRQRLLTHADEAVRARAIAAFAGAVDADREKVVNEYVAAATAAAGDPGRGRQTFTRHCSSCHRLENQGHVVGPDLAALTSRTPAGLVESILDPNRAVDERYRSYSALTADGLAHAGILTAETSTSITLTEQQGATHTLLRADLEALENTGQSLMPEGLERDLSPRDLADVIAYLAAVGPPAKRIEGNVPRTVVADYDGTLWLLAECGLVYGDSITYELPYRNIGFWHGQHDYVAWDVEVPAGGAYDVFLEWACADDSAGNHLVIEGGDAPIRGIVEGTGGYDRYQTRLLGQVALAPGANRIIVRPDGPLKRPNLMDLRGLYLRPVGASVNGEPPLAPPRGGEDAAVAIDRLLVGIAVGSPAEYERIPAIFEAAIAAGRRNDAGELLRVLQLSLPAEGQPLADWQAVAVGGGVINGLSQAGQWPGRRVTEILSDHPHLRARWTRTIALAAEMADNAGISTGTRYDALRIVGAGAWDPYGKRLAAYLEAGADPELQMGAVSALGDMEECEAAPCALLKSLGRLTDYNRSLAVEALLRTPARSRMLLDVVAAGETPSGLLSAEQSARAQKSAEAARN